MPAIVADLRGAPTRYPACAGDHQLGFCYPRNLAGNPDSPQAVIFLASITDVMMGS